MTKTIITSYATFICIAIAMAGITTAHASEVTGTLSSDAANSATTSGSISGTVSSDGSSSGGSSTRGGRGSGSSSSRPSGSVLGAATIDTPAPNFPNAGFAPEEVPQRVTLWSSVVNFFRNIVSF